VLATTLAAATPGAAQVDPFEWHGTLAQGKTIEIRDVHGSVRAIRSQDGAVHVDARRGGAMNVPIEVSEKTDGVMICADVCEQRSRVTSVQNPEMRVDFVVQIPAGVGLAVGTLDGDVDVEALQSDVTAATVNGHVVIQTTDFSAQATTVNGDVVFELPVAQNAEFLANTARGRIDADFPILLREDRPNLPHGRPILTGRAAHATIGNGGTELRVTTVGGNIHLRWR
jgi:hypothetical protein